MSKMTPLAAGLARLPSGLFILTTGHEDGATGMLISFAQQVGFEPPVVSVALQKERPILDLVRSNKTFCLSVLGEANTALLAHFARGFPIGEPAFRGVATKTTSCGIPYPEDAHAHVACEVCGEADWSDHVLLGGRVIEAARHDDEQPMVHVRKNGLSY